MIEVTRFGGGGAMVVSADLIETVESTPDTVITLTTGRKVLVQEPVGEVVRRVVAFRRTVAAPNAPAAAAEAAARVAENGRPGGRRRRRSASGEGERRPV